MPFMGENHWSTSSTQGEWSDSLYLHFPDKSREARGTLSAQTQRPAYLKHKNHASMPHLGQVHRPSTYADEVGRQRHPPAFKPKRSQSLTDAPMANQQSSATKDSKVEKHVHFIDEGYGSSATTPATSPKQEPQSDEDHSRPSTSDGDLDQLVSKQQQLTLHDESKVTPQSLASKKQTSPDAVVKTQSRGLTRSAKPEPQHASSRQSTSRQSTSRKLPAAASKSKRSSAAQTAHTGGSYRNANGNICFDEFSYFGGI